MDTELTEAEEHALVEELAGEKRRRFCVTHHYDIGDQRVFIAMASGTADAARAAVYLQFLCEEWFGVEKMLTNLGVASLLVSFYGFQHAAATPICTVVDMYADRERACGSGYAELMADQSLHREGLREAMTPHVVG